MVGKSPASLIILQKRLIWTLFLHCVSRTTKHIFWKFYSPAYTFWSPITIGRVLGYITAGAKYVGNKMLRRFQNFLVCVGNALAKTNCQRPLYIMSAMPLAYLDIWPGALL